MRAFTLGGPQPANCRNGKGGQPFGFRVNYQSDGLREKELRDSDLLKLRDAADKFGKFRGFASGG